MNNLVVANLPKPESYQYKSQDGYSNYAPIYPYRAYPDSIQNEMVKKGIKFPFQHIVDATQGTSTCPHCGAKYAGTQPYCTQVVQYHREKGYWHWEKGAVKSYAARFEIDYQECRTGLVWDLKEEWNRQVAFFGFVEFMASLPDEASGYLKEFGHLLSPGAADEFRIIHLEQEIMNHRLALENVFGALEQITEKMNSAGNALSFNRSW